MSIVDFDGVSYHISTAEDNDAKLILSIRWKCWSELVQYGAMDVLKREYRQWITEPEHGYDFTLQFDIQNVGADTGKCLFFESGCNITRLLGTQALIIDTSLAHIC